MRLWNKKHADILSIKKLSKFEHHKKIVAHSWKIFTIAEIANKICVKIFVKRN